MSAVDIAFATVALGMAFVASWCVRRALRMNREAAFWRLQAGVNAEKARLHDLHVADCARGGKTAAQRQRASVMARLVELREGEFGTAHFSDESGEKQQFSAGGTPNSTPPLANLKAQTTNVLAGSREPNNPHRKEQVEMAVMMDPADRQMERVVKAQRLGREHEARLQAALDHYATTTVPVDRIAANIGETDLNWITADLNWITAELKKRGRAA